MNTTERERLKTFIEQRRVELQIDEIEMPRRLDNALPCPFCKSTVESHEGLLVFLDNVVYYVSCGACTACGPREYTVDDAVESWNGRGSK